MKKITDYLKCFTPNLNLDEYALLNKYEDKTNFGLFIRVTDKCNKACSFCVNKKLKTGKSISIENFEKISKYYSNFSDNINLYGGEPTIHSNFDEILFIAQKYYKEVIVLTNGSKIEKLKTLRSSDKIIFNANFVSEIDLKNFPEKPVVVFNCVLEKYPIDIDLFKKIKKYYNKNTFILLSTDVTNAVVKNENKVKKMIEVAYLLEKNNLDFSCVSTYYLCLYQYMSLSFYKKYAIGRERDILSQINIGPDLKIVNFNVPTDFVFDVENLFELKKKLFEDNVAKIHFIKKNLPCGKCKYLYSYCYARVFHTLTETNFIEEGVENALSVNFK
jgi:organic radical activating enzyme